MRNCTTSFHGTSGTDRLKSSDRHVAASPMTLNRRRTASCSSPSLAKRSKLAPAMYCWMRAADSAMSSTWATSRSTRAVFLLARHQFRRGKDGLLPGRGGHRFDCLTRYEVDFCAENRLELLVHRDVLAKARGLVVFNHDVHVTSRTKIVSQNRQIESAHTMAPTKRVELRLFVAGTSPSGGGRSSSDSRAFVGAEGLGSGLSPLAAAELRQFGDRARWQPASGRSRSIDRTHVRHERPLWFSKSSRAAARPGKSDRHGRASSR